jgi:signal transduction histidine kinase
VRGMEERVRQFGGTLHIESSSAGTKVTAKIPLKPE